MELQAILTIFKQDQESVFNTWFINNDERLKVFRSIRRGAKKVIEDIKKNVSGMTLKGLLWKLF